MTNKVEERLRDLEALVVRQAERIEALEDQVEALLRLTRRTAVAQLIKPEDEAA
ncbi:hypothetical protein [Caulobacter segnis]|uniref:hypothetical protein n=1 Tax=Caulobacter segnis TaxID=88688 RepID=UPI001CBEC688|nr:hypothetical protein [Caulobacter segnis]UAL12331.1 hypothetical protein K8940_08640 [Caulobacter segnis]